MADLISALVSASLYPPNRKDPLPLPGKTHVAICVPTPQHPSDISVLTQPSVTLGIPTRLSAPVARDSTLGPQPPCDSALANQSARIPSSTLIGQEGACAPIRTMRPQEICSYFERTADFFC